VYVYRERLAGCRRYFGTPHHRRLRQSERRLDCFTTALITVVVVVVVGDVVHLEGARDGVTREQFNERQLVVDDMRYRRRRQCG